MLSLENNQKSNKTNANYWFSLRNKQSNKQNQWLVLLGRLFISKGQLISHICFVHQFDVLKVKPMFYIDVGGFTPEDEYT